MNTGAPIVFVGPSLDRDEAAALFPEAILAPPIRRGDLEGLPPAPRRMVGIIDGEFFQNFAISPKEVLAALRAGVRIYGSSSMGALRAVELAPYGMRGVGQVFRWYRDGVIDADDEVAMIFSPLDGKPLSLPMVCLRHALNQAEAAGVATASEVRAIAVAAKRLHYPERTIDAALAGAEPSLPEVRRHALAAYLSSVEDLKARDARDLLVAMREDFLKEGGTP